MSCVADDNPSRRYKLEFELRAGKAASLHPEAPGEGESKRPQRVTLP